MRKHYIEEFAKEVAALTQNWYPRDILSDEEIVSFAETFVARRVRAMESLETTPPNVTDLACAAPNHKGLRLSMVLYRLRRRGQSPQPKSAYFMEVDVPAEITKRPRLRDLGRLSSPTQGMANFFPKELAEAQSASPPCSSY